MNPARKRAGFTILEIIAVVAIVLILAGLLVGVVSRLPGAADRVRCTQNLTSLYIGLNSYTEDVGHWPQEPSATTGQTPSADVIADFWINALRPYGIPDATWICPGVKRLGKIQQVGASPRMDYMPTQFDDKPGTPHKWATQPWLVEIGNIHGHGALLILPDGSVHDWDIYVNQFMK